MNCSAQEVARSVATGVKAGISGRVAAASGRGHRSLDDAIEHERHDDPELATTKSQRPRPRAKNGDAPKSGHGSFLPRHGLRSSSGSSGNSVTEALSGGPARSVRARTRGIRRQGRGLDPPRETPARGNPRGLKPGGRCQPRLLTEIGSPAPARGLLARERLAGGGVMPPRSARPGPARPAKLTTLL